MQPPSSERWITWALAAALLLGLAARVAPYLHNRSLRLDEAALALNVLERSPAGLTRALDHHQAAPVGFLLLVKAASWIGGPGERALRLPALLLGLGALLLFVPLARRSLGRGVGALFAVTLFALSASLVHYSSDLKQYVGDAAWATALLLLALREDRRGLLALGALGLLAIFMSHPAIFVLAGIGAGLLVRRREHRAIVLAVGLSWVAAWLLSYFWLLRPLAHSRFLNDYWRGTFLSWPPGAAELGRWLASSVVEIGDGLGLGASLAAWRHTPAGLLASLAVLAAVVVGAIHLWRRQRPLVLMTALPPLLALLAAALGRYPFYGRLLLFAAPGLLLLAGAGLQWIWGLRARLGPALALALLLLLGLLPLARDALGLFRAPGQEELRPALAFLRERYRPGDTLYVYSAAAPAFDYYHRHNGFALPGARVVRGLPRSAGAAARAAQLTALAPVPRLWLVLAHSALPGPVDEAPWFLARLEQRGDRLAGYRARGAAVYLFDLSRGPGEGRRRR